MDWTPSCTYASVWAVDFEFMAQTGERPVPHCMVARNLLTGERLRLWYDELILMRNAPFDTGRDALFVAYYASAEVGCFLALGWPLPVNILDLFAEFRVWTNGRRLRHGAGLLGAMAYFHLGGIDALEKEEMRALAIRGGPFDAKERDDLIDYCETDVDALARLLPTMWGDLDLPRALVRGRYMAALAQVEANGVPVDKADWARLRGNWPLLQHQLIQRVDEQYGVFVGEQFKSDRFKTWLARRGIAWPRLASGKLNLRAATFSRVAEQHAALRDLAELRAVLGKLRQPALAVGNDGRNRVLLSAFRSKTGRNQPSTSRFIFGLPSWLRFLIRPEKGRAVAYVDYAQQEFGIAAYLSGDQRMIAAYESGDCYMAFAIQAGAAPPRATKGTHPEVRARYKRCILAVQYLMGDVSLARDMGCSVTAARALLGAHRATYPRFWKWVQGAHDAAALNRRIVATFGWQMQVTAATKARTLYNFPMQANGAEMLRLAIIFAVEAGVNVCAPVHDALLVEASADDIDRVVGLTQDAMARASGHVLRGARLRTDVETTVWPNRVANTASGRLQSAVQAILADDGRAGAAVQQSCCIGAHPSN